MSLDVARCLRYSFATSMRFLSFGIDLSGGGAFAPRPRADMSCVIGSIVSSSMSTSAEGIFPFVFADAGVDLGTGFGTGFTGGLMGGFTGGFTALTMGLAKKD
jgi:hypothetical protein